MSLHIQVLYPYYDTMFEYIIGIGDKSMMTFDETKAFHR